MSMVYILWNSSRKRIAKTSVSDKFVFYLVDLSVSVYSISSVLSTEDRGVRHVSVVSLLRLLLYSGMENISYIKLDFSSILCYV